jgi:hypothetical protein
MGWVCVVLLCCVVLCCVVLCCVVLCVWVWVYVCECVCVCLNVYYESKLEDGGRVYYYVWVY